MKKAKCCVQKATCSLHKTTIMTLFKFVAYIVHNKFVRMCSVKNVPCRSQFI